MQGPTFLNVVGTSKITQYIMGPLQRGRIACNSTIFKSNKGGISADTGWGKLDHNKMEPSTHGRPTAQEE